MPKGHLECEGAFHFSTLLSLHQNRISAGVRVREVRAVKVLPSFFLPFYLLSCFLAFFLLFMLSFLPSCSLSSLLTIRTSICLYTRQGVEEDTNIITSEYAFQSQKFGGLSCPWLNLEHLRFPLVQPQKYIIALQLGPLQQRANDFI